MALKIPRCARCSGAIELKALASVSAQDGPLKLTLLEMPLYKSTACGKEQIRSTKDLHGSVPRAMVGINDEAGFPHSG